MDKQAAFAIFTDQEDTKLAVQSLKKLGFAKEQMRVFHPKPNGERDFIQAQKYQWKTGALLGAALGALVAITFYALVALDVIPLFSPVRFSLFGRIMSFLATVIFGSAAGTAIGVLVGIGTPEPVAKR